MADREFDIVIYGATGYTGRLVAELNRSHSQPPAHAPHDGVSGGAPSGRGDLPGEDGLERTRACLPEMSKL